ncbi:MAG TPA: dockerin type I repeat-containing protein, partial [Armatimonadota bacterium]
PESDFSRTGLGQSLWIDLLAQELAVVYRNPTQVPTLPAPSVVDLLRPVALSVAEAVDPAIPAGERGRRTGAAGPSELKQVPPDPSDPGTDPAGFFNQQMHNGNIQSIFDTGPIPAPYAYAGGIVLTIFSGAALVAGAPGIAISLGVAGGLFTIWGIISTGQSLETINSQKHQQVVAPGDPNEKSGPPGVGTGNFVTGFGGLSYDVIFENVPTASASAQRVTVTDPVDAAHLDLSTFALGPITFGGQLVSPPPAVQQFATDVDLRPAKNLLLHIEAALDPSKGVATWRFTSLDPATGKLTTDPELGFLDADKNPPQGEGSVSFSVAPRPGLTTGTQITNQASVVFDVNAAIATNTWSNTLDSTRPASQVQSLPAAAPGTSFDVSWSGTDLGSGVQDYTIYVSDNGGPFNPWLNHVAATKATALGQPGHTYAFYSLARDSVNNVEGKAPTAEATTFVPGSATQLGDVNADGKVDIRDVVALLRMVVGFTTPTPDQVKAGDLDQNGSLDIGDVVKLLRRVVGLT